MAPKRSGSAVIFWGMERIPVSVHPGSQEPPRVSFTTLCAKHGAKIEQVLRCPVDKKLIENEDKAAKLTKGYPLGKDRFLPLSADDLKEVEPEGESVPEIHVEGFLEIAAIEPCYWTGKCQFLAADVGSGPVTDLAAARSYASLVDKLIEDSQGEGLAALGRWLKVGHDKLVAIATKDRRLMALELRRAGEVRDITEIPAAERADQAELDRLDPLVRRLTLEFYDPTAWPDSRYDATVALLTKKVEEAAKASKLRKVPRRSSAR